MINETLENGEKVVRIAEEISLSGTLPIIISLMFLGLTGFGSIAFYRRDKEKRKEEKADSKVLMDELKKSNKASETTMYKIAEAVREFAESNRTLSSIIEKNEYNHQTFVTESQQIRKDYLNALERVNDSACGVRDHVAKLEEKQNVIMVDVKEMKAIIKAN